MAGREGVGGRRRRFRAQAVAGGAGLAWCLLDAESGCRALLASPAERRARELARLLEELPAYAVMVEWEEVAPA